MPVKKRSATPAAALIDMIGWKEWLALPDLGIPAIKAKIDTGARTSSLHTFDLQPFEHDGVPMVRFGVHPLRRKLEIVCFCTAVVADQRNVTDSGGHVENRYVIRTPVRLGSYLWSVEITLTNREGMLFRMLLGRTALANRFQIDPGAKYLIGKRDLVKTYDRPTGRKKPT